MQLTRSRAVRSALVLAMAASLAASAASAQSASGGPSVSDYGVGTGVEDRNLVGKAESFPEGTKVYFWTRIVDGESGDRVYHVWMREGEEVLSIGLSIGGSHWRTYSNKTLHPGSAGSWRVEVRDPDGKVLASQDFTCTPAD